MSRVLTKCTVLNRIVKQRQLMLRWHKSNLCPMIQQRLELSKKAADKCLAVWNGDPNLSIFEVSRDEDKYVVKLDEKTCACRRWELSGLPCSHAIACMWAARRVPEEYVHQSYR